MHDVCDFENDAFIMKKRENELDFKFSLTQILQFVYKISLRNTVMPPMTR